MSDEWPPRFTWTWRGIFLSAAKRVACEQNQESGIAALERIAEFLDHKGVDPQELIDWDLNAVKEKIAEIRKARGEGGA